MVQEQNTLSRLNERKRRILEAVITDYVLTAEPVGSRTIAKKFGFEISSATIRNEMSDLEEMGLLRQLHASSGRVPSDKGYRLYADEIVNRGRGASVLTEEDAELLQNVIRDNAGHIDFLMKETAKAISRLTNLAAVVTAPSESRRASRFKHLQLVELDEESLILVVVTEEKTVKNFIVDIPRDVPTPTRSELAELSNALDEFLKGSFIKYGFFLGDSASGEPKLEERFGVFAPLLPTLLQKAYSTLASEENSFIYASGMKNLLALPEFSDINATKALFQTMEEKDALITMFGGKDSGRGFDDIQILIGDENNLDNMHNCSVIKMNCRLGGGLGAIGILGPTRMNYEQVVAVLNAVADNIRLILP